VMLMLWLSFAPGYRARFSGAGPEW